MLEHRNGPIRINPVILLDTGIQASCIRESVVDQLRIPRSVLKEEKKTIISPKGTPLENLSTV